MRIPIATGTPSGALPAATAARSLAHEESIRRSAREPDDGATAAGPTEPSVITASPRPRRDGDRLGEHECSIGGADSDRVWNRLWPSASLRPSGHFSDGWRPNGGRRTVVQQSRAENRRRTVRAQRPEPGLLARGSCSVSIRLAPSECRVALSPWTVSASRGNGGARVDDRSTRGQVR
jgi:hypothetical protein